MPQSLVQNYIHIIFATKNREALINPPYEQELHAYLGSFCNKLDCQVVIVGGYYDHVHILCKLSKKIALVDLIQKLKSTSSKWMKTKHESLRNFYWQDGYGVFSINANQIEMVMDYIKNQHQHHANKTFKQEYRDFLDKYHIEYNEKYVWD